MGIRVYIEHIGDDFEDSKGRTCRTRTIVINEWGSDGAELLVDWFDHEIDRYSGIEPAVDYEFTSGLLDRFIENYEEFCDERYERVGYKQDAKRIACAFEELHEEFGNEQFYSFSYSC